MFDCGKHKRTEMVVTARLGQPLETCDLRGIEVPACKLAVTWSLRRNTQGTPRHPRRGQLVQAAGGFSAGNNANVPGILMKQTEQTRDVPLAGLAAKVTTAFETPTAQQIAKGRAMTCLSL
jgi:hypothetical protein